MRITEDILNECMKYIGAPEAQELLEKYCENIGISMDQITSDNIAMVVLEFAKGREDFENLDEDIFYHFLDRLIALANSCYGPVEPNEKEALIAAMTGEKHSYKYNHDTATSTDCCKSNRKKESFVAKLDLPPRSDLN